MTQAVKTTRGKSYHHGDLHNALMLAAAELIEESGSVDFSMVDAARRAGVSSAAPYRHFKDKDALLEAVAQLCFMALSESGLEAVASEDIASEQAVIALGRSYINFVLEHRPFYDLMWGDHGARAMKSTSVDLKGTAFYSVAECVRALCEKEQIELADPLEAATKLWAMVHGLAALAMNGQIDRFMENADVYALLESSTHIFFDGLRHQS
jgi:AcrR family transcriptional regulator